jgi:myo-inositol 2-dehydrogenase/D-chiro-inositol 1-dehydrogenase
MSSRSGPSRRGFLGAGSGASLAAGLMVHSSRAAAEETRELRLAIIGCGGRGSGAVNDSLTINERVKLVAAADLYPAKCVALREALRAAHEDKLDLADDKMYGGLDGYKRVFDDPEVDVVLLATSPGFRPRMIREAIHAGKHVFAEKPACVDPAGYRICLEAHARAVEQGLAVVTGTQYRRQANYIGAVDEIRKGTIGEIVGGTTRYCTSGIWYRARKPGMSDAEHQLNNWMHFIWLSGDQIVEQAVHNIDLMNWVMGGNPVSAFGCGGRFTRPADSEMWDSMTIDYDYPGGTNIAFMCRQIPGTAGDNGSVIRGTEGTCFIGAIDSGSRIVDRKGNEVWRMAGSISAAYKQEHKDLIDSIRAGRPIVELAQTADSSLAAVLGRVAAYTGQRVTFDFLANESKLDLFPAELTLEAPLPPPRCAIPGKTKLV